MVLNVHVNMARPCQNELEKYKKCCFGVFLRRQRFARCIVKRWKNVKLADMNKGNMLKLYVA